MDDKSPSRKIPINYHPDSVQAVTSAPALEEAEKVPPTPKPYEPLPPEYQKNKGKKVRYVLIVLIISLAVGAVYWFVLKPKPSKAPISNNTINSETNKVEQAKTDTEHYDSPNFNLGFDYPKGWKVSDISGSGKLTVSSPTMKLKDADGQQVDSQIVMMIRDKTQKLSEFDKGAATAIIDSEKVTYTKPSETQRGDTYISFLNYAGSKDSGIDAIYISGDAGYQKNQSVPAVDISRIDPITNVTFMSDSKPITVDSESWSDSSFSKPIKALLQSLAIQ